MAKASAAGAGIGKEVSLFDRILQYIYFYIMFIPVLVILFAFYYLPMWGIRFSLYKYNPYMPPSFLGLDNFERLFQTERFWAAFNNTIILSLVNLFLAMFFSVLVALLLNEIYTLTVKKFIQTVIYLPHFLSWVVIASIFMIILSPQGGFVNEVLVRAGFLDEPIYFLANERWWRPVWYFIQRWKETGWGTIIYLAALSGISPELYEAAEIDGAGRLKQTLYITIPSLMNTILIVFILQLAKVMNVFESVFVLYNPLVYNVSDVIQTYVYRVGLVQADYGYSTAVGLFKSFISLILVVTADYASNKIRGRGIV